MWVVSFYVCQIKPITKRRFHIYCLQFDDRKLDTRVQNAMGTAGAAEQSKSNIQWKCDSNLIVKCYRKVLETYRWILEFMLQQWKYSIVSVSGILLLYAVKELAEQERLVIHLSTFPHVSHGRVQEYLFHRLTDRFQAWTGRFVDEFVWMLGGVIPTDHFICLLHVNIISLLGTIK